MRWSRRLGSVVGRQPDLKLPINDGALVADLCGRHTVTAVIAVTSRAVTAAAALARSPTRRATSPIQNVPCLTAPLPDGAPRPSWVTWVQVLTAAGRLRLQGTSPASTRPARAHHRHS
jgi:hypothetical protein